jgi:predicted site-specific integrase-resolvase
MDYVKSSFIRKKFDISSQTLQKWADSGKVKSIKTKENGRRLFHYQSFLDYIGASDKDHFTNRKKVCYARVSQKEDLIRQIRFLKSRYPKHEIIKDIGSSLNWKRNGLQTLLERIIDGSVEEVVVTHQDRLSRFSFDLLYWLFQKFNCKLVVLNQSTETNPEIEMSGDVLSIINYFVAKNNGRRAAENKKIRDIKSHENKIISESESEKNS